MNNVPVNTCPGGDLLTIAALLAMMYQLRGYVAVQSMPAGLALTAAVDFYRAQFARQRDLASDPWRYLAFFVPGVGLSLFGRVLDRSAAQNAVIAAVGVALCLTIAWLNRRTAAMLQHEIDELD